MERIVLMRLVHNNAGAWGNGSHFVELRKGRFVSVRAIFRRLHPLNVLGMSWSLSS